MDAIDPPLAGLADPVSQSSVPFSDPLIGRLGVPTRIPRSTVLTQGIHGDPADSLLTLRCTDRSSTHTQQFRSTRSNIKAQT